MAVFEKNVELFHHRQVTLYENLMEKNYKLGNIQVSERTAKNGENILVIQKEDGKEYLFNSNYNPSEEARRWAKQYEDIEPESQIIIYGLGNFHFIKALKNLKNKEMRYVIYEPSIDIFLYVMNNYDFSEILDNNQVWIFVEGLNELTLRQYCTLYIEWSNLSVIRYNQLPQYEKVFEEKYAWFLKEYRDMHMLVHIDEQTGVQLGKFEADNVMNNLRFLVNSTSSESFIDVFPKELPVILVSAGPSLKNNISTLKKVKNKAFILSTDTALKYLLAENIIPDAVMIVDSKKRVSSLLDYRLKDVLLIAQVSANHFTLHIFNKTRGRIVFSGGENSYFSSFFKEVGQSLLVLETGGSVANSAFSLLYQWGFKTVILIGQDLALTGKKRYLDDTTNAIDKAIETGMDVLEIEDNNGEKIITRTDYYHYLRWFEEKIVTYKGMEVINATEGGAKICGTKVMSLQEAINKYCEKEFSIKEILDNVEYSFNTMEKKEKVYNNILTTIKNLKILKKKSLELVKSIEKCIEFIEKKNISNKQLMKEYKKIGCLEKYIEDTVEICLIIPYIALIEHEVLANLYKRKETIEEEQKDILTKMKKLYNSIPNTVDDIEKKINSILKYENNNKSFNTITDIVKSNNKVMNAIKNKKILAIIPARSGSKTIPNKNIREFAGAPMMAHSIVQGLWSKYISRVIVSTDSIEYANVAKKWGAEAPFLRPKEYAEDTSLDIEVFEHALKWLKENEGYEPDVVVQLRPTCPVRDDSMDRMIEIILEDETIDSVRSLASAKEIPYKMWTKDDNGKLQPIVKDIPECYNMPRQQLPKVYYQNACIDIIRPKVILEQHSMSGKNIVGYEMAYNFDIDTEEDFRDAETFMKLLVGNQRFVFDIDGVIAEKEPNLDYDKAKPRKEMIEVINQLYEKGNKIVLHTARGYVTGIDWNETTKKQLDKWGLKYHELHFSKPNADFYIDDKMLDMDRLTSMVKLMPKFE